MTILTSMDVPCPKCKGPLSGHTSLNGDHIPSIGDITICTWCGAILEYAEGATLHLLSDAELIRFAKQQPKDFAMMMEAQQFYREQNAKKPN